MHSGVITGQLSAGQTLPEIDMLPALSIGWLAGQHPSVRSFRIGADANVGIQAEAKQQVAKQDGMVF